MKEVPENQLVVGSDQVENILHDVGQDVAINLTGTILSKSDTGAVIGNVAINECEAVGQEGEDYSEEPEESKENTPENKGAMPKAIAIIMSSKKNTKK